MAKHWKKFIAMFALSWLAGAVAIAACLYRTSIEDFSVADMVPMWVILAVAGLLLSAACSMPLLLSLHRRLGGFRRGFVFPLANALLVTSLVAAFAHSMGAIAGNLAAGEAWLFTVAFFVLSLTFGLAFVWFYGAGREQN